MDDSLVGCLLPRALRSAQTGHDSLLSENSVLQTGQVRLSVALTPNRPFEAINPCFETGRHDPPARRSGSSVALFANFYTLIGCLGILELRK